MTDRTPDEADIRAALAPLNLGEMLDGVNIRNGDVKVSLAVRREDAAALEPLRARVEETLASQPGVRSAAVMFTARRPPPAPKPPETLPGVAAVIAVASGKGGVGKSTVAVNLAIALAQSGRRVGLLDADVHGPSLPRMLGLQQKPQSREGRMVPLEAWGLQCMSIGFLVEEETAMVWRGPMVASALTQMLGQVEWGALDVLVVDMPPGTGDIQLTLTQKIRLAGAVIVSTPQDIALIDARRAVNMFGKMGVEVLGIVENMSYFVCPSCQQRSDIFGHGGAASEALRTGVAFLGEVPLQLAIRETGDAGLPICAAQPGHAAAAAFRAIAAQVAQRLGQAAG